MGELVGEAVVGLAVVNGYVIHFMLGYVILIASLMLVIVI